MTLWMSIEKVPQRCALCWWKSSRLRPPWFTSHFILTFLVHQFPAFRICVLVSFTWAGFLLNKLLTLTLILCLLSILHCGPGQVTKHNLPWNLCGLFFKWRKVRWGGVKPAVGMWDSHLLTLGLVLGKELRERETAEARTGPRLDTRE